VRKHPDRVVVVGNCGVRSEACFGKAGGCSDLVLRCSGAGQQRRTVVSECGRARSGVEPWCARRQGSARRLTLLARACLCTWVDFRGYRKQASKQASHAWRRGRRRRGRRQGDKLQDIDRSIKPLHLCKAADTAAGICIIICKHTGCNNIAIKNNAPAHTDVMLLHSAGKRCAHASLGCRQR
jgi:hypothetical protein